MVALRSFIKQHIFILPVLAAIAIVFAVAAIGKELLNQSSSVLSQKTELNGLKGDLDMLDGLLADEKKYRVTIESILHTLPRGYSEVSNVATSIEALAKETNTALTMVIDEKLHPETGGINSLTMTLKTESTYSDFRTFLSKISRLPYHTRISTIQADELGSKVSSIVTFKLFSQ